MGSLNPSEILCLKQRAPHTKGTVLNHLWILLRHRLRTCTFRNLYITRSYVSTACGSHKAEIAKKGNAYKWQRALNAQAGYTVPNSISPFEGPGALLSCFFLVRGVFLHRLVWFTLPTPNTHKLLLDDDEEDLSIGTAC